ncbi:hypothetical protein, conserved [Eimeria brunetti]|uniref:Aminopeptidase N n=1 Tax=Eimeria brunetti TaxID=51314 RepID=U6LDM1_9EIME|nr:hypothetical protein, conserved [Eimeria brunetti]
MGSAAVKRIEDVAFLKAFQFQEDAGPMKHPIRPESYIAMDNFYTLTVYEKGAEAPDLTVPWGFQPAHELGYQTLLGREGFRKGMDLYFQRHDGQAVTCDDFRQAMADANKKDFTQFERWYSQAGTPEVTVLERRYVPEEKKFILRLQQQQHGGPLQQQQNGPMVIPVRFGLIGKNSKKDILDPPTQALTLQLPSIEALSQELQQIDPDALHLAVHTLRKELAAAFKEELAEVYRQLSLPEGTKETLAAADVARRRLRNTVLRLLTAAGDAAAAALAAAQFSSSKCMTDKYAALMALADMQQPQKEQALKQFYEEAKGNPIMLDKYFRVQAAADVPDAAEKVQQLQQHEDFSFLNPNRLRSLFSAFVYNRKHFHRKDGKGYTLVADAVIKVDAFNPQAAARLAGAFLPWQRYDKERQQQMKRQLLRIGDTPGLSPDTLEIVQRALKAAENKKETPEDANKNN